jgi:hypothetical protein
MIMDELAKEYFTFTRYLYIKAEVKHSLFLAILEHNTDEALFWTYELYYSGFKDELIDLILLIYNKIFIYTNQQLIKFIERKLQLSDDPINDGGEHIGSIIYTLSKRKYNLIPFIEEFFKVKCNPLSEDVHNDIYNKNNKKKLNINITSNDIIKYQTIITDTPNTVFRETTKYPIRKNVNKIFDMYPEVLYNEMMEIYNTNWLFYTSNTPIWIDRINEYNGVINEDDQTITFNNDNDEEMFMRKWYYDQDEQPKYIREYHIGTGDEIQIGVKDFCKKFNITIATRKLVRRK